MRTLAFLYTFRLSEEDSREAVTEGKVGGKAFANDDPKNEFPWFEMTVGS